jgi:aspartate carbamoyltransferase catalytic subunit
MFSSAVKGESLHDTVRIIGHYSDAIVLRHPDDGSAQQAAQVSPVPIINAGDGRGQHPTQALLDVYTIMHEMRDRKPLHLTVVGDLACGRTVHSLVYLMGQYNHVQFTFVSPNHLRMPQEILDWLSKRNVSYTQTSDFQPVLPTSDIVYMTRIQKERMDPEAYKDAKGTYVINEKTLSLVPKQSLIMHPLPHVEEIDLPIAIEQQDPRIAYFRQAQNGLFVRMALLDMML